MISFSWTWDLKTVFRNFFVLSAIRRFLSSNYSRELPMKEKPFYYLQEVSPKMMASNLQMKLQTLEDLFLFKQVYLIPVKTETYESVPAERDPLEVHMKNEIEDPLYLDEDVKRMYCGENDEGSGLSVQVYLVPTKEENFENVPVGRDPLEVDLKEETEDPLCLEEDACDEWQELDLQVSSGPLHLPEEDESNSDTMCTTQEHQVIENIAKEPRGEKLYSERMVSINLKGHETLIIQKESAIEDGGESAEGVNDYCNNLNEKTNKNVIKNNMCKGRLNSETRIKKQVKDNFSAGYISNCKRDGRNCSDSDCLKHISVITNTRKTERDSIVERTVSQNVTVVQSVDKESDEAGLTLNGTNPYGDDSRNKRRGLFCDTCRKVFIYKSELVIHVRSHTGDRPFKCSVCNMTFSRKSNCVSHSSVHSNDRPYVCKVCGKSFKIYSYLIEHIKIHSNKETYHCEVCSKTFCQRRSLLSHMKFHRDYNPYPCITCGAIFKCEKTYSEHLKSHSPKLPFCCEICGKYFAEKRLLKQHRWTHDNKRPFSCKICDKSFKRKGAFKKHMITHNGMKPFKCSLCEKAFSSNSHLQSHLRSHSTERPYECPNCSKCYKYLSNVHDHMKFYCKGK